MSLDMVVVKNLNHGSCVHLYCGSFEKMGTSVRYDYINLLHSCFPDFLLACPEAGIPSLHAIRPHNFSCCCTC